jgi:general secretion pathway protein G
MKDWPDRESTSARPSPSSEFTLLEVLVVVAILVILAAVAGVYVFGYLEGARVDSASTQIGELERACINYTTKNHGIPPESLEVLVTPISGGQPLISGGANALLDPWGKPYQYDPTNVDQYGNPDPLVMTTDPQGNPVYSAKRKAGK